ncbi:MAG: SRPBCC family protein [Candidatus Binatia bacterium]
MAIEIKETFTVQAPVDAVWDFVLDPHKVAACMPGATLEGVEDDETYLGSIKVKVGAVSASYRGRVRITEIDEEGRTVRLLAEGTETGGGTAKGSMFSRLRALPGGGTEVVAEASVDITGRVMQVGRGMVQGVSHQLFLQFVSSTRERLEAPPGEAAAPPRGSNQAISIVPLVLRAFFAALARFLRRLLGRE